jgi:hypothetical protein
MQSAEIEQTTSRSRINSEERGRTRQQTDGARIGGGRWSRRARTASGGSEWSCRSLFVCVCTSCVWDGSMATGLTKPEKVRGLDRILFPMDRRTDGRSGNKEEVSEWSDVSTEHGLIPMSWSSSAPCPLIHLYRVPTSVSKRKKRKAIKSFLLDVSVFEFGTKSIIYGISNCIA